jgi:hypothetical protein
VGQLREAGAVTSRPEASRAVISFLVAALVVIAGCSDGSHATTNPAKLRRLTSCNDVDASLRLVAKEGFGTNTFPSNATYEVAEVARQQLRKLDCEQPDELKHLGPTETCDDLNNAVFLFRSGFPGTAEIMISDQYEENAVLKRNDELWCGIRYPP